MFRQTWTRSNCAKAPPLCSRFRDRRLVIVETTLYPPEQRARLPSLGYLTEIRTRVAGIKSYLDSDSAGGGNFSPSPAGLGESRWWTKVQRVPTGLNSMEKCFPTRFPALRSFRCQIRGTSRNESNFITKGCCLFSNSPSDNWKHCCWWIPSSALAPHPSVPMTSSSYHISRRGDHRLINS